MLMDGYNKISDLLYGSLVFLYRVSRGMNIQFPPLLTGLKSEPWETNKQRSQAATLQDECENIDSDKARQEERSLNSFALGTLRWRSSRI